MHRRTEPGKRGRGERKNFESYVAGTAHGNALGDGKAAHPDAVFSGQDAGGGGQEPWDQPGAGQPDGEKDSAAAQERGGVREEKADCVAAG